MKISTVIKLPGHKPAKMLMGNSQKSFQWFGKAVREIGKHDKEEKP